MSDDYVAGRALDALVAERVMGWKWLPYWCGSEEVRGLFPPAGPFDARDDFPEYSTDIAAAWAVWEHVARTTDLGLNEPTVMWTADGWVAGYMCADAVVRHMDGGGTADATPVETAPLAICLAALDAVGAKREEGA